MVLPALVLTFVLQQSPPLRQLKVASCPAADSLLGPPRQDRDGAVRGSYDAAQDSTFLVTGTGRLPDARRPDDYIFSVVVRFEGRALSDYPAAQFNVLVRGSNALRILADSVPPPLTLRVDDSLTYTFASPLRGRYAGPTAAAFAPLSVPLTAPTFLAVAKARKAYVQLNRDYPVPLDYTTARDLKALYRVATCGLPQPKK